MRRTPLPSWPSMVPSWGSFRVGNGPVDILFDGESIWVANAGDDTVTQLSLLGLHLGTYRVGDGPVALAFDGQSIWVANLEDSTLTRNMVR